MLKILKISPVLLMPTFYVSSEKLQQVMFIGASVCALLFLAIAVVCATILKRTKEQSRRESFIDAETGIGNRADFLRSFENIISDFSRTNYWIAYFVVDSNQLLAYNYDIPFSEVVRRIASRLSRDLKDYEFVARVTESGFALAFRCVDQYEGISRVRAVLEDMNKYVDPTGKGPEKTFVASLYRLEETDRNCEKLLFNLRNQCSQLVGSDKHFILCDSKSMNSVQIEKEFVERIMQGLKDEEFKLYIQFIVDNENKDIVSAEALSRWENPEEGILLPGNYLGTMMKTGLIIDFDYYMFEQVCMQLEKWKNTRLGKLSLSCNFTRITISEEDFVEQIQKISNKYSFDKQKLIMEVTEEAVEKNRKKALLNMEKCKKMGFVIALDDFGSGYTAPVNLSEYPLDIVKIDRTILLNTEKANGKELFGGLVALAHNLNLKVVCEGVENEQQNEYVSSTVCDYVQGWYFSKATPAIASEEFAGEFYRKRLLQNFSTN